MGDGVKKEYLYFVSYVVNKWNGKYFDCGTYSTDKIITTRSDVNKMESDIKERMNLKSFIIISFHLISEQIHKAPKKP